jgi:hypothetical protein
MAARAILDVADAFLRMLDLICPGDVRGNAAGMA